ncbi:MAG: tRNA (adenosine(37)-N6)-dimethylallyltransferase MiaA [Deltaproteobacteria bacterium]|nr:tRNA (adenosine(37)-N6)-dimethylallyltransferase MiaA [Deltaproteobacteria bacterium]
MKPKIIIVVGPTAVGKSEVALDLAGVLGAEIVNADSQQVYRYMDIGTAKPSPAERQRISHHLIDVVNPDEEFSAARFRSLAMAAIVQIQQRGHSVIVCGGTGLYIKALTKGLFVGPARDEPIRARLSEQADRQGLPVLYQRLAAVDAAATSWIHPNDRQRILRALEVFELTGRPMSEWQKEHAFAENPLDYLLIGLDRDRKALYEAINQRCGEMMARGLVEEVASLVQRGYVLNLKPLQSVGYRHAGLILSGEVLPESGLEMMKQDTRHLAKRQLTWFRGVNEVRWFHPGARAEIRTAAQKFLAKQEAA